MIRYLWSLLVRLEAWLARRGRPEPNEKLWAEIAARIYAPPTVHVIPPAPPAVTDWFTDRDPWEPGVYERNYNNSDVHPCKWDGSAWLCFGATRERAALARETSPSQSLPWRGLASPPKATP